MNISKNQIKFIKSLSNSKNRIKSNIFICEGVKLVEELLISNFEIVSLFAEQQWIDINEDQRSKTYLVNSKELNNISSLKTPNQVLALVKIPSKKKIIDLKRVVLLDNIQDPGNLGTIIRTCDWFNISNIICSKNTVNVYNPKVVQSTMGSIFRVNIEYRDLNFYLEETKLPTYAACLDGENIDKAILANDFNLLIGNESNGISNDLYKHSLKKISIKQINPLVNSLNASVANGILLKKLCY